MTTDSSADDFNEFAATSYVIKIGDLINQRESIQTINTILWSVGNENCDLEDVIQLMGLQYRLVTPEAIPLLVQQWSKYSRQCCRRSINKQELKSECLQFFYNLGKDISGLIIISYNPKSWVLTTITLYGKIDTIKQCSIV